MVQSLLEDRFHLKVNHATKQQSVYALTVAKNGLRLKANNCTFGEGSRCGGSSWGNTEISGTGIEPGDLASMLTDAVDLPVIDKTGLAGRYDVTLHWTPQDADTAEASIFTAIQEQLGLKLQLQKGRSNASNRTHRKAQRELTPPPPSPSPLSPPPSPPSPSLFFLSPPSPSSHPLLLLLLPPTPPPPLFPSSPLLPSSPVSPPPPTVHHPLSLPNPHYPLSLHPPFSPFSPSSLSPTHVHPNRPHYISCHPSMT